MALKLWDLAPDGTKTLVTRGEYRLPALSGDGPAGRLSTELNGNGWDFEGSHRMELISQTDVPYLRPDDLPSSMTFSNVEMQVPIREGYNRTVVAP